MHRPKLKKDEVDQLQMQFARVDRNKDGKLDHDEFRAFLKETFPYATQRELDDMTPKRLQGDTDEKIDFLQYIDFMSQDISLRFDVRFIRHQKKAWEDKLGLGLYIPFLVLFCFFLVTGKGLGSTFWLQHSVMEHLLGDEFKQTPDLRYFKAYEDIAEVAEYWAWQEWPGVNTIWPTPESPTDDPRGEGPINGVNYVIGGMKLRQVRVKPRICPRSVNDMLSHNTERLSDSALANRLRDFRFLCYDEYESASAEQDTENIPVQIANVSSAPRSAVAKIVPMRREYVSNPNESSLAFDAYTYRTAKELNGSSAAFFNGKVTQYPPHGHAIVIPFSRKRSEVLEIFRILREGITVEGWTNPEDNTKHPPVKIPWLDHATRGISVEFFTYNQNLNIVARFQLFIEVTASGRFVPLHMVNTFQFFSFSDHSPGYYAFMIIFFITILVQCGMWCSNFRYRVHQYLLDAGSSGCLLRIQAWIASILDFWVMFDFVNLGLFLVVWGLRFYWMSLSFTKTSVLVLDSFPDEWETVGEIVYIMSVIDAFNALLSFIRVFYFLRLNSQLNLLTKTIAKAKAELIGIVFIFLIVFIGFSLMAFVVFGNVLEGYRNFSTTISSLLRMLLGDFDYEELREQHRTFAPVLFAIFNIVSNFLLLNMVIAVLNQAFAAVQEAKFKPGRLDVLLTSVNEDTSPEGLVEPTFADKIRRKHKGCQHWIRGTSMWRELVYMCNVIMLYTKTKDELPGGEEEWEARYREAKEYNPRTFWGLQEDMMFYQKRSINFRDKLNVVATPLKFHLLEEFGEDLPYVIELNTGMRAVSKELAKHDLVIHPSDCFGTSPQTLLVELMDYFHTWRAAVAPNYARVEVDADGEAEVEVEDGPATGIAMRGPAEVADTLVEELSEWWDMCQGKKRVESDDLTSRYEKQRREQEKMDLETYAELRQIEEQSQNIINIQRQLDDMHSMVTGKVHQGDVHVDAKDVLVPNTIEITSASPVLIGGEVYDANGIYARRGNFNGRPFWKREGAKGIEDGVSIVWGDGCWWIGKPRSRVRDRMCVPSLYMWYDRDSQVPPQGIDKGNSLQPCVWEAVMDGGVGNPPELSYRFLSGGMVDRITVSNAGTHQVNGEYMIQEDMKNGKRFWRKRYQVICRHFKVVPFPWEAEKTCRMRAALRSIRDQISEKYNVTLRVPGEPAARDRRMQLEGDWQMCAEAFKQVLIEAREVIEEARRDGHDVPDPDADADKILPEVFLQGERETDEQVRVAQVQATAKSLAEGVLSSEWESIGNGYDIDLMWEEGRWVIAERVQESNQGYVGFHDIPPRVAISIIVRCTKTPEDSKWEDFMKNIPAIMAKYQTNRTLLDVENPREGEIGQNDRVHLSIIPRVPQPGADESAEAGTEKWPFKEGTLSWAKDRHKHEDDAMVLSGWLSDTYPDGDAITAEVKINNGRLKDTWLDCTVVDEPDVEAGPLAKYKVAVDLEMLQYSPLVLHQRYYDEQFRRNGLRGTVKTMLVTKDRLRKRQGQDTESWVTRLASWLNDPDHPIHKEYPGILASYKTIRPKPHVLYCCEDPDTRNHPPLYPTEWLATQESSPATPISPRKDTQITLIATTQIYIKKGGIGGLDRTPLYLSVHHAYMKGMWQLVGTQSNVKLHKGENVNALAPCNEVKRPGETMCAEVKTDDSGREWLQFFRPDDGTSLDLWAPKTEEWVRIHPDRSQPVWQCTGDSRDDQSMYVCTHRWKNDASTWELQRAPERGSRMYLRKVPVMPAESDAEFLQQVMTASNYPLSYKGDGKPRYLSLFGNDSRMKQVKEEKRSRFKLDRKEPASYVVSAHEQLHPTGEDYGETLWEVVPYPKTFLDPRMDTAPQWWQKDPYIIDWMKYDMHDDGSAVVPSEPRGMKWSGASEVQARASEWELAPRAELERRVIWYLDNWRVARLALEQLDDPGQSSNIKGIKQKMRQLKLIDAERERQRQKVLIRKVPGKWGKGGNAIQDPFYLSVWSNFPEGSFDGLWTTRQFFSTTTEDHVIEEDPRGIVARIADGQQDLIPGRVTHEQRLVWKCFQRPLIGQSVLGEVYWGDQELDCMVTGLNPTTLVLVVDKWKEMDLRYEFTFHQKDDLRRDENSHFVIATQDYRPCTHTLWEIEPVQELDLSIDKSVRSAIKAQQEGLHQRFRDLIHEEMTFLLKTVVPNLLLDELGPNQLVQTLNYKIRSESAAIEEAALKGVDLVNNGGSQASDTDAMVAKWRSKTIEEEMPMPTSEPSPKSHAPESDGEGHPLLPAQPAPPSQPHPLEPPDTEGDDQPDEPGTPPDPQ